MFNLIFANNFLLTWQQCDKAHRKLNIIFALINLHMRKYPYVPFSLLYQYDNNTSPHRFNDFHNNDNLRHLCSLCYLCFNLTKCTICIIHIPYDIITWQSPNASILYEAKTSKEHTYISYYGNKMHIRTELCELQLEILIWKYLLSQCSDKANVGALNGNRKSSSIYAHIPKALLR